MARTWPWIVIAVVLVSASGPARGDGGFFYVYGEAADLAQRRQEVVMAIHRENNEPEAPWKVTYVLKSRYVGEPNAFAWVVPLPAVPTDVVAHDDDRLFEALSDHTRPRFMVINPAALGERVIPARQRGAAGRSGTAASADSMSSVRIALVSAPSTRYAGG